MKAVLLKLLYYVSFCRIFTYPPIYGCSACSRHPTDGLYVSRSVECKTCETSASHRPLGPELPKPCEIIKNPALPP